MFNLFRRSSDENSGIGNFNVKDETDESHVIPPDYYYNDDDGLYYNDGHDDHDNDDLDHDDNHSNHNIINNNDHDNTNHNDNDNNYDDNDDDGSDSDEYVNDDGIRLLGQTNSQGTDSDFDYNGSTSPSRYTTTPEEKEMDPHNNNNNNNNHHRAPVFLPPHPDTHHLETHASPSKESSITNHHSNEDDYDFVKAEDRGPFFYHDSSEDDLDLQQELANLTLPTTTTSPPPPPQKKINNIMTHSSSILLSSHSSTSSPSTSSPSVVVSPTSSSMSSSSSIYPTHNASPQTSQQSPSLSSPIMRNTAPATVAMTAVATGTTSTIAVAGGGNNNARNTTTANNNNNNNKGGNDPPGHEASTVLQTGQYPTSSSTKTTTTTTPPMAKIVQFPPGSFPTITSAEQPQQSQGTTGIDSDSSSSSSSSNRTKWITLMMLSILALLASIIIVQSVILKRYNKDSSSSDDINSVGNNDNQNEEDDTINIIPLTPTTAPTARTTTLPRDTSCIPTFGYCANTYDEFTRMIRQSLLSDYKDDDPLVLALCPSIVIQKTYSYEISTEYLSRKKIKICCDTTTPPPPIVKDPDAAAFCVMRDDISKEGSILQFRATEDAAEFEIILQDISFINGYSDSSGGNVAMVVEQQQLQQQEEQQYRLGIYNCYFSFGYSQESGGNLYVENFKHLTITNTTFANGISGGGYGGGVAIRNVNHIDITNCTFDGNVAEALGGGLYVQYGVEEDLKLPPQQQEDDDDDMLFYMSVQNSTFTNNVCEEAGGAFGTLSFLPLTNNNNKNKNNNNNNSFDNNNSVNNNYVSSLSSSQLKQMESKSQPSPAMIWRGNKFHSNRVRAGEGGVGIIHHLGAPLQVEWYTNKGQNNQADYCQDLFILFDDDSPCIGVAKGYSNPEYAVPSPTWPPPTPPPPTSSPPTSGTTPPPTPYRRTYRPTYTPSYSPTYTPSTFKLTLPPPPPSPWEPTTVPSYLPSTPTPTSPRPIDPTLEPSYLPSTPTPTTLRPTAQSSFITQITDAPTGAPTDLVSTTTQTSLPPSQVLTGQGDGDDGDVTEDNDECVSTIGPPCISTFEDLRSTIASLSSLTTTTTTNVVIGICGNGIPITTEETLIMTSSVSVTLCCVSTIMDNEECVLEATGAGHSILVIESVPESTLKDITFRNGDAQTESGGNVAITNTDDTGGGDHFIINCVFLNGKADQYGGNLHVHNVNSIWIERSYFSKGRAHGGGALAIRTTSFTIIPQIHIEGCSMHENRADHGGGMYISAATGDQDDDITAISLHQNMFHSNVALFGGAWSLRYTHYNDNAVQDHLNLMISGNSGQGNFALTYPTGCDDFSLVLVGDGTLEGDNDNDGAICVAASEDYNILS